MLVCVAAPAPPVFRTYKGNLWFRMHSSTLCIHCPKEQTRILFDDVDMISGHDVSRCDVLHLLAPLVSSNARLFRVYRHIRNVRKQILHIPRSKSQNSLVTNIQYQNSIYASVMCCIFWCHCFLHKVVCSWDIIIFVMFRTVQTLYIIYSHSKE